MFRGINSFVLRLAVIWSVWTLSVLLADELTEPRLHCVSFRDAQSVTRSIEARLLLTAQDGGLLLEGRDGQLWTVVPQQLLKNEPTDERFQPLTGEELGKQLQLELIGFGIKTPSQVVVTKHYVICSTAGRKYAEWVGILFERLHDGFQAFWKIGLVSSDGDELLANADSGCLAVWLSEGSSHTGLKSISTCA